jgi:hypothetical protein
MVPHHFLCPVNLQKDVSEEFSIKFLFCHQKIRFKKVKEKDILYISTFLSKIFHHFLTQHKLYIFFLLCHVTRHITFIYAVSAT